jgi:hypothetical protein
MVEAMVRLRDRPVRGALAIDLSGGGVEINSPHADRFGWNAQMQDTFGTRSGDFSDACINWLANAAAERGKPLSQTAVNAALAVVAAAEPANEMEALLAVQMFATHDLSMELMRRAKQSDNLRAMTEYGTLATKLSRTMTAQIEALGKLRRGGEQTVRVEHVHVYEGGQAVVGVVNTQGGQGADGKRGRQSYGPDVAAAIGPALLGQDPQGNGVPVPSNARPEKVPHPRRRQPRRTKGQS